MGQDSAVRTQTKIESLIDKKDEVLKAIANELASFMVTKVSNGESIKETSISNMISNLSPEDRSIVLLKAICAYTNSQQFDENAKKKNSNYNPSKMLGDNDLFRGRGF